MISEVRGSLTDKEEEASTFKRKYQNILHNHKIFLKYVQRYGEASVAEAFELVGTLPQLREENSQLEQELTKGGGKLEKVNDDLKDTQIQASLWEIHLTTVKTGSVTAILETLPTLSMPDLDSIILEAHKMYDRKLNESILRALGMRA